MSEKERAPYCTESTHYLQMRWPPDRKNFYIGLICDCGQYQQVEISARWLELAPVQSLQPTVVGEDKEASNGEE